MAKTSSFPALLHVALQDLHAGKLAQADRLPALAAAARDPALRALIEAEVGRAREGARRLEGVASDLSGPANLWIAGILDDAERDARSHQPGSVLDVALVGAVRKAKAAEAVSSETAIALARASGAAAIGEAAAANHAEEVATDGALRDLLDALTR